jgi:CHAT domain-containing protein
VADVGAEALMREFYYLRTKYPALSKAEAFQRAQLALLRGEEKSLDAKAKEARIRGPQVAAGEGSKGRLPYKKDPSAPFAHPHYWAPFILIGNSK